MDEILLDQLENACRAADYETLRMMRVADESESPSLMSTLLFRGEMQFGRNRKLRGMWMTDRILAQARACIECLEVLDIAITDDLANELIELLADSADPNDAFERINNDFKTIVRHDGKKGLQDEWDRLYRLAEKALIEARYLMEASRVRVEARRKEKAAAVTNNFYANGENSRINYKSTDNSTNITIQDGKDALSRLCKLSEESGNAELISTSAETARHWPEPKKTTESLARWVGIASGMANIMHQAAPILEKIYSAISSLQ